MTASVIHADCLDAMRAMEADSIDAIVTDPPYGLVQNKRGGSGAASVNLNSPHGRSRIGTGNGPGGFMGKEWDSCVPGVPFWTEALRVAKPGAHLVAFGGTRTFHRLACAIEDAGWEVRDCLSWLYGSGFPKSLNVGSGRGTALKPAWEPAIIARKPLAGTVAANVLAHGTGAINVDACRIDVEDGAALGRNNKIGNNGWKNSSGGKNAQALRIDAGLPQQGRWPANVALDEEAAAMLGEPARFFYTAKASRKERGEGNTHPTVKPTALMRWLVRLVTPPGGLVLDPFAGSGTTLLAARAEGFRSVGIEREAEYVDIIRRRLSESRDLFSEVP